MPPSTISSLAVSGRGGGGGGGKTGSEPVDNDGFPLAALPALAEGAKSCFAISSGSSWPVDNDGPGELFILLEKNDRVVTSNSSASHEWFPSVFMCVCSGSVSRMFSVPVGRGSSLNCSRCSWAAFSLAALPVLSVGGKSSSATSSGCSWSEVILDDDCSSRDGDRSSGWCSGSFSLFEGESVGKRRL